MDSPAARWPLAVLLAVSTMWAGGQCYFFPAGHAHHYTYTAVNSMVGHRDVNTVIKFHINFLGEGTAGERIHSLHVNSFVQYVEGGPMMFNPLKWNLTRNFVFVSNSTGAVTLVHVHPKDHEELLVLKKAVVSIFSVHVQIEETTDDWQYGTEETDHLGRLQHTYNLQRTGSGMVLNRRHESDDKVYRSHNKTLHFDSQGTLQRAVAHDHVVMDRKVQEAKFNPGPQAAQGIKSSGDYPGIEAAARVTVKYTGRKRLYAGNFQQQQEYIAKLTKDTLEIQHKNTKKKQYGLDEVRSNLTEIWGCIHFYNEADNENRSGCVNDLRKLLSGLKPNDYKKYVTSVLARNCSSISGLRSLPSSRQGASLCREERWIVLDVVASIGDDISQQLLVMHVLSGAWQRFEEEGGEENDDDNEEGDGEDLRRVFFHCSSLKHPMLDFVKAVEAFCFGVDRDQHGTRSGSDRVSRTQTRACLAVGSLAKHLSTSGHPQEADRLAARLEAWSDQHGQGDSPVYRKDTREASDSDVNTNLENEKPSPSLPDEDDGDDRRHMTKAALLHALGNGGLLRSRDHLLRHAQPDAGHHIWRRAAVRALGQFQCEESGRALMASLTKDSLISVRRVAWNSFLTHPFKNQLVKEQEDDIVSDDYTYRSVARVKRSVFDNLDRVLFQFKVATPSYEWNHNVGIPAISGRLGVKIQNSVEGMFRLLSGYVDVDVHDKLYADAQVLNGRYKVDLIHVEACYRGRLTYNLNIMKDFSVDLFSDVSSLFNQIIRRLLEPIEKVADKFISDYQDASTGEPKSAFQPLADAVGELPKATGRALEATKDLSEEVDVLGVLPSVTWLKDLVSRARVFLEDIHNEAVELFGSIDEETRVALPFAEEEIKGAVNGVLDVLNKVKDYPKQAFSVIEMSKLRYQLSMMMILEARKSVKQAFSFLTGSRSSWNSGREELKNIREQIKSLKERILSESQRRKKRQATASYKRQATEESDTAMKTLGDKIDVVLKELGNVLNDAPKQLEQALDLMAEQTDILKTTFVDFKQGIDIIKTRFQALFGTKFHPSFPAIRRDCDEECRCGVYPTDCTRYGHPGVDLVWNKGWKVPNPASGMVYVLASNTSLRIEPKTDDLKQYQIYISNVQPDAELLKNRSFFAEAGKTLGVSLGNNGCNKGHIHVAMRRTSADTSLCHYIDPTAFLNHNQPKIRWQQECNEFVFRISFQVTDLNSLTKGFKSFWEELKRDALDFLKDYGRDKLRELIPDDSLLRPLRNVGFTFLDTGKLDWQPVKDLFDDTIDVAKTFIQKIKVGDFSIQGLLGLSNEKAQGLLGLKLKDIEGVVKKVTKLPKTFKGIDSLSIGRLTRLWSKISGDDRLTLPIFDNIDSDLPLSILGNLGKDLIEKIQGFVDRTTLGDLGDLTKLLDRFSGGRESLMSRLKETIREKACPYIGKFLRKQNSPCVPHDDCRGLSCVIALQKQNLAGRVHIDVKVDKNDVTTGQRTGAVRIIVDGQEHTVRGDAQDKVIPANLKVFGTYDVKLRVTSLWTGAQLAFSLKVQACDSTLRCLPDSILVTNIVFSNGTVSSLLSGIDLEELVSSIKLLPLDVSHKLTTDLDVDNVDVTNTILSIEDLTREELKAFLPQNTTIRFYEEFHNPEEYSDQGTYPPSSQRIEIYKEFFRFEYPVHLGPAFLIIRISAGGAVGLSFNFEIDATKSGMQAKLTPWVSFKVEGGLSISIIIVAAGVDVRAWLLQTGFPLILHSNYTKTPVILTKQIDLELIPVRLELVAWFEIKLEIKIWGFKLKLFSKRWSFILWHYTSPGISRTIWKKIERKDDLGPPQFPYCTDVDQQCSAARNRGRRSSSPTKESGQAVCFVRQLTGRHLRDPAYSLDFSVEDEASDLAIYYAVGDYLGGTNIKTWTPMRGQTLTASVAPAATDYDEDSSVKKTGLEKEAGGHRDVLPCGRPLYFLVRARNSQGLEAVAQCSLDTLDCSSPGGRVDMAARSTSHRDKLAATVVVYEDSQLKTDSLFYAVGLGPGPQGDEVVGWTPLELAKGPTTHGSEVGVAAAGYLTRFSPPREGRLSLHPHRTLKAKTAEDCARKCSTLMHCVSFSYASDVCELQTVAEGTENQRRVKDGGFVTYEKLDQGRSARLNISIPGSHQRRSLRHGVTYYINAYVENVMGFRSVLTSWGTTVDLTSPDPGYLGEGWLEEMVEEAEPGHPRRCSVSIIQRCVDPAPVLKHRKFIDGEGSTAVLNGGLRGQELKFTMDNSHVAANWNGFEDGESGIYGFTMAVGTKVGGTDVSDFVNTHANLSTPRKSNVGMINDLHLADRPYYVTVQALSDTELGGNLVTTVCHSTPFIVDTTPPVVHGVNDIVFDNLFRLLAVYFNATDAASGVARVEFGLGKTRHDVSVRGYRPFEIRGKAGSEYFLVEEFQAETGSGEPVWIRLKAIDNVGLSATGSGNVPILVDNSEPLAGKVLDGDTLGLDACCTSDAASICAQWSHFEDPQSHIDSYLWGVGRSPGKDDVVTFHRLSPRDGQACATNLTLAHNVTYFSTIVAFNTALNQKSVNASSDGVLVDLTPPVAGRVADGDDINNDVEFTSEAASMTAVWTDFNDPETGLASYTVSVYVNDVLQRTVSDISGERFSDRSLVLKHGDTAHVEVTAFNGAGSDVVVTSDGQKVDHTPPELVSIGPATKASPSSSFFQTDDTLLSFAWKFRDAESGVVEFRASVFQRLGRAESLFWPSPEQPQQRLQHVIIPDSVPDSGAAAQNATPGVLQLQGLRLVNGASYLVQVTAVNRAKMAATTRSPAVTIDTTPPVLEKVQIALLGSIEEVNENGDVEHVEGEPLSVTWKAHDFESGLSSVQLCVGLLGSDCLSSNSGGTIILDPSALGSSSAVLDHDQLPALTENEDERSTKYQVLVVAVNGAGQRSSVARSRPLVMVKGNVAGLVLDGTSGVDEDFTSDRSGISLLFFNFSSQACGIESYEWGAGTAPCQTDILPFSEFGLVVEDTEEDGAVGKGTGSSGSAQADVTLEEGQTYYTVVRARTGHACHEPFVVSCSNGITVDTTPPQISFFKPSLTSSQSLLPTASSGADEEAAFPLSSSKKPNDVQFPLLVSQDVVYQTADDRLEVGWNVVDAVGVNRSQLILLDPHNPTLRTSVHVPAFSRQPFFTSQLLTPSHGESVTASLWAVDKAGNEARVFLPTVTFDFTPPSFENLSCTDAVSAKSSQVVCSWTSVHDPDSALTSVQFGLGSGPAFSDLSNMTEVHHLRDRRWHLDTRNVAGIEELSEFYVIGLIINAAGREGRASVMVRRDATPPSVTDVVIVTSPSIDVLKTPQRCQTSTDFIEVDVVGAHDDESGIDSVEFALGTSRGAADIHSFQTYDMYRGVYVRGNLGLMPTSIVYVMAKVTNGVGLYTVVTAEAVTISPEPWLEVKDGSPAATDDGDADGQADLNVIQGQWTMHHPCPVLTAEWSVSELGSGHVLRHFTAIPASSFTKDDGGRFYDDTFSLDNLKTYVNHVRVTDTLGRTFAAFSDGVTVSVGIPAVAPVWEGLPGGADLEFQQSLHKLAAAWEEFGNSRSASPSDRVVRYSVAVGTDPLRPDVHRFVDVGLATSFTFRGLNLTPKNITYYVTVRAHSAANTFSENYSNGVKAGYSDVITPGEVDVSPYQSDTTRVRVSWAGFKSDMGVLRYYVGVGSNPLPPSWTNKTQGCEDFFNSESVMAAFDVKAPQTAETGEAAMSMEGLTLNHNQTYYVTVVAEDEVFRCSAVTSSDSILVDTTRPVADGVDVIGYDAGPAIFVPSTETVSVNLESITDDESGVRDVVVDLIQTDVCRKNQARRQEEGGGDQLVLLTVTAEKQSLVTLRGLNLQEGVAYFIKVTVTNGAELETQATTKPLLVAVSQPSPGTVKLGQDWASEKEPVFQSHQDAVQAVITLLPPGAHQACVTERNLVSTDSRAAWETLDGNFSRRNVFVGSSQVTLTVRHNDHLKGVERGAATVKNVSLIEGKYSFHVMPAAGAHILTGIALASAKWQSPFNGINEVLWNTNITRACGMDEDVCSPNATLDETPSGSGSGFGLSFLESDGSTKLLFWIQDDFKLKRFVLPLAFDPVSVLQNYTFTLMRSTSSMDTWDVSFSVDGQIQSVANGFKFRDLETSLSFYTWKVGDYFLPVIDPFRPFRVVATLAAALTPLPERPLCSYGQAFRDTSSEIREVWAGVSDSLTTEANVAPFRLVKQFCRPCLLECQAVCLTAAAAASCKDAFTGSNDFISDDMSVLTFSVSELSLEAANNAVKNSLNESSSFFSSSSSPNSTTTFTTRSGTLNTAVGSKDDNTTPSTTSNNTTAANSSASAAPAPLAAVLDAFRPPTYHVDVKVVTHSGREAVSKSQALTVDTSPPSVDRLEVTDPSYSDSEPVRFVGTKAAVGVHWKVSEDVSVVEAQWISLGSEPGLADVVHWQKLLRHAESHLLDDLDILLEDEVTYHVNLRVTNSAGLSANSSAEFTVSTTTPEIFQEPPARRRRETSDAARSGVVIEGVVATERISGADVTFMKTSNNLTLSLPPLGARTAYLEWSIGTHPGAGDILPKVIVANPNITKVAIVNGRLEMNGYSSYITVEDYAKSNFQPSPPNSSRDEEKGPAYDSGALFRMEPGRCVYQRLYGVSRSHKEAAMDLTPLCFKRPTDYLITSDNPASGTHLQLLQNVDVNVSVSIGGIIVGALTDSDLDSTHGSAASAQFSPFVVRPDVTDSTSRSLRGRMTSLTGRSFFMSPLAGTKLSDDVSVTYKVPTADNVPIGHEAKMLFWSAESLEWRSVQEACPLSSHNYDKTKRQLNTKICFHVFTDQTKSPEQQQQRTKRSGSSPATLSAPSFPFPRMFTVAVVDRTTRNSRPVLSNLTFTVQEEAGEVRINMTYSDDDGDVLTFKLLESPRHGWASLSPEGVLTYRPPKNYAGDDVMLVQGVEVLNEGLLLDGAVPNVAEAHVLVTVINENDPPDIFFFPDVSNNTNTTTTIIASNSSDDIGVHISVLVEGNTTTTQPLGVLVLADSDPQDAIVLIERPHDGDKDEATFRTTDTTLGDRNRHHVNSLRNSKTSSGTIPSPATQNQPEEAATVIEDLKKGQESPYTVLEARSLSLSLPEGYRGRATYEARVKDASDAYSVLLKADVHVLISPCQHGRCQARVSGETCNVPERAFSFGSFYCLCDPGFEGEFCEAETDECSPDPCNALTDCVDLVNDFRCEINTPKLAALAGGVFTIVLIIVGFVLCFSRNRLRAALCRKTDRDDAISNTNDDKSNGQRCSHASLQDYPDLQHQGQQHQHEPHLPDDRRSVPDYSIPQGVLGSSLSKRNPAMYLPQVGHVWMSLTGATPQTLDEFSETQVDND